MEAANDGGLGINRISVDSKQQYEISVNSTKLRVESILEQAMGMKETIFNSSS